MLKKWSDKLSERELDRYQELIEKYDCDTHDLPPDLIVEKNGFYVHMVRMCSADVYEVCVPCSTHAYGDSAYSVLGLALERFFYLLSVNLTTERQ